MSKKKPDHVYNSIYAPFMRNTVNDMGSLTRNMYQRVLTELSVNRFKWTGLPDSVDERFLEMTLFFRGLSIFYFDNEYDKYMAMRGSGSAPNMYDNPTRFNIYGQGNYRSKILSADNAVPIWSNYLRSPDHDIVQIYSNRLSEIDRTIDINLLGQRHPVVLAVNENERLSVMNAFRQVQEGQPVIAGTHDFALAEKMQALNLGVDKDLVINTQLAKDKVWNECMTLLGIRNANQNKKERMVVDEVNANEDQVVSARGVSLNARKQAADMINTRYDLAIDVGWNDSADVMASDGINTIRHIGSGLSV